MRTTWFLLACGWMIGCIGDDGAAECPAPFESTAESAPDFAISNGSVRVGNWTHEMSEGSRIEAAMRSEPVPSLHQIAMEEGACRQRIAAVFRCDEACQPGEMCTAENTCTVVGLAEDAGVLTVAIGDQYQQLETDATEQYLVFDDAPVGESCDPVTISAAGNAFPAFSLQTAMVPPLEVTNGDELGYFTGQPLTVRWTPADPAARVRLTLLADSAWHGAVYPSIIECDLPDAAGEVTVSAAMIDSHLERFGCGNCPMSSVTRYRRVVTSAGPTEVELVVYDEQQYWVVPGGAPYARR